MVSKFAMVVVGAILLAISITGIVALVTMPTDANVPVEQPDVTFDGPIFAPKTGTESFVFGTVEQNGIFSATGTGIFEYMGVTTYGTLYVSDMGYWLIVDPIGQVTMSGSPGSVPPEMEAQ